MRSTFPIRNTALWLKRAANGVPGATTPPTAGSSAPAAPPAVGKVSAAPPAAPSGGAPKPPLASAAATPFTDKLMTGLNAAANPKTYTAKPLQTATPAAAPIATPGTNIPPVTGGATMAAPSTGTHINGTGANASVQPTAPVPNNPFTGGGIASPHAPAGGQSQRAIANDNAYRQNTIAANMQYARDKNDPNNVAYQGPVSGQAKDRASSNAILNTGGYVLPGGASTVDAKGTRTISNNPYGTASATTIPTVGTPAHAKWLANKSVTDDGKTIKGPDAMRKTLEPMLPGQQAQSDKAFALNMAQKHPEAFNGVLAPGTQGSVAGATGYVNAVQGMPNGSVQLPTAAQGPTLSLNLPPAGQAMAQQNAAAKTIAANAPATGAGRQPVQVMPVGAPALPPPTFSQGTLDAFDKGMAGSSALNNVAARPGNGTPASKLSPEEASAMHKSVVGQMDPSIANGGSSADLRKSSSTNPFL